MFGASDAPDKGLRKAQTNAVVFACVDKSVGSVHRSVGAVGASIGRKRGYVNGFLAGWLGDVAVALLSVRADVPV